MANINAIIVKTTFPILLRYADSNCGPPTFSR